MVVDSETGSFQCERADIIMDVGETLNAAIDIGQARLVLSLTLTLTQSIPCALSRIPSFTCGGG